MLLADLLLSGGAFLGHFALCVWCFNRTQALDWHYKLLKVAKRGTVLFGFVVLIVYFVKAELTGICLWQGQPLNPTELAWLLYPLISGGAFLLAIPLWLWPKITYQIPAELVKQQAHTVNLERRLGKRPLAGRMTRLAANLPGNQILFPRVEFKRLQPPYLPVGLIGLKIVHLSDLHMTGKFTPDFYHWIVAETNRHVPDLVVLTGDLVEAVECLDWVVPTLGKLRARLGKFFVLGNHDKRLPKVSSLRERLADAGCEDAGGKCFEIPVNGSKLILAGNELPWFGPAPHVPALGEGERAFRLLLTHTPDQFAWAKQHQFDLVVAGHNHGGQIRLPGIGALFSPSLTGVRYNGGLYCEAQTLLHVSRGLAGVDPVRLNCPPELAVLELVGGEGRKSERGS